MPNPIHFIGSVGAIGPRRAVPNVKFVQLQAQHRARRLNVFALLEGNTMKLTHRRRFLHLAAGAAAVPAVTRFAAAQAYPTRPIRLVVPFPPGGAFDALARPWADKMKALLGTVVVENIGGGGSSLGASAVARARPDGYAILLGGTLTHINEALLKSKPLYDPVKDLDPIVSIAVNYLGLAVHPSVPAHTLKQLVAYAKANPGKLSYGHAGAGSLHHLSGELFKSLTGTPEIVQVPYRGAGPVITDLVSGQISMGVVGVSAQVIERRRLFRSHRGRVLWAAGSGRHTKDHWRTDCTRHESAACRGNLSAIID
jgi:hypothetical protein